MTGAITTNSTFDGRDVASDGTKLDTIETNADVTDTTNVTAAGALMDSEVTNLAQVKAFDSADYATAAQGTLADSAVQPNDSPTFAGLTTTADVSFGDNDKAIFGAGSDLQIYHDDAQSTNFLISQASANMSIGTSGIVNVGSSGSNVNVNGAVALVQGNDQVSLSGATVTTTTGTNGVVLDNNGSPKLATTATGIDVTGTVTADAATLSGRLTLPTATYHYSSDGYARLYYYEDGDTLFRTADDFQFRNLANTTIAQIQDTGAISTISTVTATSFIGDGSALTGIAAGATGGGNDDIFYENGQNVTTNYTITNGKNAMSAGPITIDSGVTVTVGAGETWTVI